MEVLSFCAKFYERQCFNCGNKLCVIIVAVATIVIIIRRYSICNTVFGIILIQLFWFPQPDRLQYRDSNESRVSFPNVLSSLIYVNFFLTDSKTHLYRHKGNKLFSSLGD